MSMKAPHLVAFAYMIGASPDALAWRHVETQESSGLTKGELKGKPMTYLRL